MARRAMDAVQNGREDMNPKVTCPVAPLFLVGERVSLKLNQQKRCPFFPLEIHWASEHLVGHRRGPQAKSDTKRVHVSPTSLHGRAGLPL